MKTLVPVTPTANAVAAKTKIPPAIKDGIEKLILSFAAGAPLTTEDRHALLHLYAEATAGFQPSIAEHALVHLRLHNPRNPFRPNPQDVHELCQATKERWYSAAQHFEDAGDVPEEIVIDALRAFMAKAVEEPSTSRPYSHFSRLVNMPDRRFRTLPDEVWPDGLKEQVETARQRVLEKEEEERRQIASRTAEEARRRRYENELGPDLWKARTAAWAALWRSGNIHPTEEELLTKARQLIARQQFCN